MAEGLCTPLEGKKLLNPQIIKEFAKRSCSIQFSAISENCMHEPISEQLFDTVQEHNPILNHISLYHLWITTMQGEGCTLWLSVCDKLNVKVRLSSTSLWLFLQFCINYRYPVDEAERQPRWHSILHEALNAKCRSIKNDLRKKINLSIEQSFWAEPSRLYGIYNNYCLRVFVTFTVRPVSH